MKKIILIPLVFGISFSANAIDLLKGEWIDLSHDFSAETIYWPTADTFKKETVFQGFTDAGFYYTAYNYCAAEHGGTHLDAPIHFAIKRQTVDQIPIEQLIGPGQVIRIADKTQTNRNYQLTVADIVDWEKENGVLQDDSILFVDTGSSQWWPDRERYMGTDERGAHAIKLLKFPGIHPNAARFLAIKRKIKAVGIDTPSIDFGGSTLFEAHQILFEKNIPGLENVANLDQLPLKGFVVIGLPMKIKGGSGGPLRIVAFLPAE